MNTFTRNAKGLGLACLLAATLLVGGARAADWGELGKHLDAARENMMKMLDAKDASSRDAAYDEVKKATKELDAALADMVKSAPEAAKSKLNDFKSTWEAFKNTRDSELVPAALSGDPEKVKQAKEKAGAIQKERFGKMKQIIEEMAQKK
ncbi:MAG: MCP four helix bundle domain-containing protein [Acidobacteria bacterium]|nr:MCP four helix bundle domain-containing protein [Acidobacteriota bacterium]